MAKFKAGDKVKCVNADGGFDIKKGETFTVKGYFDAERILVEENHYEWFEWRFELVEEPVKLYEVKQELPQLSLRLGEGVGIILDPNIPFSRKFAEAFLDAVYGVKSE